MTYLPDFHQLHGSFFMTSREAIVSFLNEFLEISKIPDVSANGLQVEGTESITKISLVTEARRV